MPDINFTFTGKVFRYMVLSFFVSNILTVLGTMMASFTASNAIEVAAMSLRAYTVGLLFQQKEVRTDKNEP